MAKARSTRRNPPARARKRVLIVTGSRSEFGLLRPVMDAVKKHRGLELLVVVAGEHLLKPGLTVREVEKTYRVAARVPMQRVGDRGRVEHAAATARGMQGFASAFKKLKPDWVVVLGDRIEAFAAASAASIAGIAVCHIHGGDRAEGIADEAMRHAITKLSHLHCAATKLSAERITKMGERAESVHVTGSPAIDGLENKRPMSGKRAGAWKDVCTIVLFHPSGCDRREEQLWAGTVCAAIDESAPGDVLAIAPNTDPDRDAIDAVLRRRTAAPADRVGYRAIGDSRQFYVERKPAEDSVRRIGSRKWFYTSSLGRDDFLALLLRANRRHYGLVVGNSSAGLIEAAALGLNVLNVGQRQAGRERAGYLIDVENRSLSAMIEGIELLMRRAEYRRTMKHITPHEHPLGDGRTGPRIAALLAKTDPHDPALLRKRNSY